MCDRFTGLLVACSRLGLGISAGACGVSPTAVRRRLSWTVSSSRELCASSEVLQPATCPRCPARSCDLTEAQERLPWGSLPSSRRQPAASTHGRDPTPDLRSVLGVSHALDGLLRHRPCGFVSPRCHVQGSPCRGLSLSTEPYRLSPASFMPSCRWTKQPAGLTRRQPSRPRLQGLAPRRECGAPAKPVKASLTRAPLGLLLLRVFSSCALGTLSRPLRPRPSLR